MADLSDRQAAGVRQGAAFETTAATLLRIEGWTITATKWRHPEFDVEVDICATDPAGVEWWIECKGSWEGNRQGLKRTDTLKKALFNGAMLRLDEARRPYMIICSHVPNVGTAGVTWLERAKGIYVDAVRYLSFTDPDQQPAISPAGVAAPTGDEPGPQPVLPAGGDRDARGAP